MSSFMMNELVVVFGWLSKLGMSDDKHTMNKSRVGELNSNETVLESVRRVA